MENHKRFLSVIVPAYKQEKTIKKDLENIEETIKEGLGESYDYEIICVVDGELDKTREEAMKVKSPKVKIFSYKENKGKGFAVRYGMKQAKGDLISFLDAGMDISPKGIMMLMAHMDWYNADIIVGSKKHPVSRVNYPFIRRLLSFGYHLGIKVLFDLPLTDTQSGIKIFKREVVEKILPRLLVKTYAMDIEFLAVAKYLGFDRIYEGPIEVRFNKSTSGIKWSTSFWMAWDTMAVFYRLKILHYYDEKNKKNWITD
ncbi:MAG: glycosyltransferase family 2 protein [Candidatus Woesebacteria bacterium]|nr:glycosyltransferase family 2 protein [Candidatus Woesebacteria bacterium]